MPHYLSHLQTIQAAPSTRTIERLVPTLTLIEVEHDGPSSGLFYYRFGNRDAVPPTEILCDEHGLLQHCAYVLEGGAATYIPEAVAQEHDLPTRDGRPLFDLAEWPPNKYGVHHSDSLLTEDCYLWGSSLLVTMRDKPAPPVEWLCVAPTLRLALDQAGRLTSILFPALTDAELANVCFADTP